METINLKRAYDPAAPTDGYRVLVDRLWPRGMSHETLHYDLWEEDVAPSTELREWFHQDPTDRWEQFMSRYTDELRSSPAFHKLKSQLRSHPVVTLLYGSHDVHHNNAAILRQALIDNI